MENINLELKQKQLLQMRENEGKRNIEKPLFSIDNFVQKEEPESSEDKAPHERAYYVELTRKALGIHWKTKKEYSFGQVNGLTKGWSKELIRDRYEYCTKHVNCEFGKAWFGIRKKDVINKK